MTGAASLVRILAERGQNVAVAESLTGGLLAAAFVEVPGASRVFAGGVVAYQTEQKVRQLGIRAEFLAQHGTVDPDVARMMADSVRSRFETDFGLATTGVAGPGMSEGKAPGTVFIAIARRESTDVLRCDFEGDRQEVRNQTVLHALSGLVAILKEDSQP